MSVVFVGTLAGAFVSGAGLGAFGAWWAHKRTRLSAWNLFVFDEPVVRVSQMQIGQSNDSKIRRVSIQQQKSRIDVEIAPVRVREQEHRAIEADQIGSSENRHYLTAGQRCCSR